tara:strand:- start:1909 stop:2364 length:456 start_codon:yes stop_codon:yes gene_type:complete
MFNQKWNLRFLDLACHVAQWSKDPSTKVGAVIVRPDRTIASMGYNGFPRGMDDDPARYEDRAYKLAHTVHAEINALANAHEPVRGYGLFTSLPVCGPCSLHIIQHGIDWVVSIYASEEQYMRWGESMLVASDNFFQTNLPTRYYYKEQIDG